MTEEGIKRENQAPNNRRRKNMESGEEADDPVVEDSAPSTEQSGTASSSSVAMTDAGQRNLKRGAELESDQKNKIIRNGGESRGAIVRDVRVPMDVRDPQGEMVDSIDEVEWI